MVILTLPLISRLLIKLYPLNIIDDFRGLILRDRTVLVADYRPVPLIRIALMLSSLALHVDTGIAQPVLRMVRVAQALVVHYYLLVGG